MKMLLGGLWLCAFVLLGERLVALTGAPIPGSIAGMLLLWLALETGAVRLSWLDRGATGLLHVLPLLFVLAGVGILQYTGAGPVWIVAAGVICVGALLTLGVVGHITQRGQPG
jgi:holin-like protein